MSPTDTEREAIATTAVRDLLSPMEFDDKRLVDGVLHDNLPVDSEFWMTGPIVLNIDSKLHGHTIRVNDECKRGGVTNK